MSFIVTTALAPSEQGEQHEQDDRLVPVEHQAPARGGVRSADTKLQGKQVLLLRPAWLAAM